MEPLSKVWTTVEKASKSCFEQVEVSIPEILINLEQTVMLLGQAFYNVLYARHFTALKEITRDPRNAKQLLKSETFFKETIFT